MNLQSGLKALAVSGLCVIATACATTSTIPPDTSSNATVTNDTIKSSDWVVTTWNVEHLAYPISDGCKPRTEEELGKLQAYAASLDADIVALQEVASIDAMALLFPKQDWQLFISERPDSDPYECRNTGFTSTQQKVAYAVRKGIDVLSVNSLAEFGLDSRGLRHGLELNVASPFGPVSMLNVHMKSGCFVDNYSRADSESCQTFAKQAPILDAWIEAKEQQQTPYIVLGDFNHRLSAPYNHLTRQLTSNSDNSSSTLVNTTANIISCHPWYPAPIDHILVGHMSDSTLSKTTRVHAFEDMAVESMLSDHCAISLSLEQQPLTLSNAVLWQTTSKEYMYLTEAAYTRAAHAIKNKTLPDSSWVVMMDIDETVLDNSEYQVRLDRTDGEYSPDTWAMWVAEEQATLVPGVKSFINTVLEHGGKLALVTNRDRSLDKYTWRNMQALGLPVSLDNACLIGKSSEDDAAVGNQSIINNKDLRRQQLQAGTASCFSPEGPRHSNFTAQQIIMQIGDNIEDFTHITQEDADIQSLLPKANNEYILLPNPMYGSW